MVYAREDGQDIIDTLQHHNINEIGILNKDYIYIVYKGRKLQLSFLSFGNRERIINIQKKTTRNAKLQYDQQNPTVVASKYNASRITVAGYDATATDEDLIYNERIFNIKQISLEDMRDTYNTINQLIFNLLDINQRGRGSYLVSGSDMGVGKSTFLTATIEKVPDYWGIGILDTQDELQVMKKYPHKNVITLIENSKRSIAQEFQVMLKMARDVIFVGEITKPEEISELLNASLRLNSGVGGTIHLISPFEAVANCRNLLMGTDMYDQSDKAEEDIARGIDFVLHLAKLPNGRIVLDRIVEICYTQKDLSVESDLTGTIEEKLSNTLNLLQFALLKYLYPKCYQYNEILRYDRGKDCWIPVNLPSQQYFNKIQQYVSDEEIEGFKAYFLQEQRKAGDIR
nr:ATPase, T2SS/T4P/T4SS family [Alkaliphilus hydrothermalis]